MPWEYAAQGLVGFCIIDQPPAERCMRKGAGITARAAGLAGVFIGSLLALGTADSRADEIAKADVAPSSAAALVEVLLHTQAGDIEIALDLEHAPLTAANFLRYVDQKRYDGASFYRAVKIDGEGRYGMLQGGLRGGRVLELKPIAHESPAVTGLHHVDGAVSMARNEPGTATSEFFIVMGDLSSLDGGEGDPGYAVFGHVEAGMAVVHGMLDLRRSLDAGDGSMSGQMLASPVKILTARRVAATKGPE
jgi:peptidyl-prolyl cis-trans isomerase A (cyclophilin A)